MTGPGLSGWYLPDFSCGFSLRSLSTLIDWIVSDEACIFVVRGQRQKLRVDRVTSRCFYVAIRVHFFFFNSPRIQKINTPEYFLFVSYKRRYLYFVYVLYISWKGTYRARKIYVNHIAQKEKSISALMKSRTTRSLTTQHSKQDSSSSSRIIHGWYHMVLAGSTYYHARVLDHHPWRAADSNNE